MTQQKDARQSGFTLLELMITIAIIAIIAAIAIPSYTNYTKKAHYSELVHATTPYKLGVAQCYTQAGSFIGCNSSTNETQGIPPSITAPPNAQSTIAKITVTNGVITAVPNAISGISPNDIYILTPSAQNGIISWRSSGQGVTSGLTH